MQAVPRLAQAGRIDPYAGISQIDPAAGFKPALQFDPRILGPAAQIFRFRRGRADQQHAQRFRLGPAVGQLTHAWSSSLNVSAVGQAIMHRVWAATQETVALFVPQGAMRLCVAELPSPQALSFKRGVGYQERIVLGASGQVILAHADTSIEAIERYAEGLNLDPIRYAQELRQIKKRGYATSKNALIEGAVAIAAPFFNSHGQVAGSIAVFGPGARLKDAKVRQFGAVLVKEAAALSQVLGHN